LSGPSNKIVTSLAAVALSIVFGAATASAQADSGFYIRGMAGGAWAGDMVFKDVNPNASNALFAGAGAVRGGGGNSPLIGAGVGYKFTPMLWADLGFSDMTRLHFDGKSDPALVITDMNANIDAQTAMLNTYLDVARLLRVPVGSLQPFVMAGLGYAHSHIGTVQGLAPRSTIPSFSVSGHDNNNVAWGAGAGLGMPVTDRITIDLAYEYIDLGELRTGTIFSQPGAAPGPIGAIKTGLHAHTLQASLRYGF
jgi:opacity protein-like surface antigen